MASSSDALIEDNRSSSSIFSTKVLLKSDPKKKLDHDNNNDDDNDNASVSSDGSFDLLTEFRKSRNNNNQNQNTNNDKPSQQQQQQQQVAVKEQQQQQDTSPPPPPPPPSSMEALKCSSLFTSSSEEDDDDEEEEEEEVESNRHNRIEKEKPKKHIRWRTHDDDDDDDYDYDYDTKKYNYNDKENRTFSSSSSSSPNRKKRESPSKSKKKSKNKNNTNISPVKTTKKSYGISPLSFHRHKINNNNDDNNNDNIWKDEFHQSVADKVLLQEKQEYRTELEQQRKIFKKKTCMKRWPVQQMAMDHLHHLLSPNSSNKQYHGGEYMSGESSSGSSISSSEEKKIRRIISSARAAASSSSSSSSDDNNDDDGVDDENENEKAKAAAPPKSSSSQDQDIVIDTDEPLWSMEPRIFATEKAQGKRKYLVGHFGRIADWYWRKSDATNKHLYEVIRENTPCRLYFDLEYSKMYNTDIDSQRLLDEFLIEIKTDLQQYYNIQFTNHQLIDLDSSTDVKFSKHWIFDFDSQGLFEDAPCVGRFVKRLVGRLAEELATGVLATKGHTELAKSLFVQTKDSIKDNSDGTKSSSNNSKPTCFVDLGVYTKNRLFRVLGSSKFGKTVSLQPSTTNLYPNIELPKKQQQQRQQQVSSSPETTTTSPKAAITDLTTIEDYIKANDWCPHARALANTLVIPLKETKASGDGDTSGDDKGENRRILTVPDDEASRYRPRGSGDASKTTIRTLGIRRSVAESFLPSLDQYVFDVLATRGDVQGTIRAVSVEYGGTNSDEPISITYQLSRNRYCELIGRQHKSNNVYWTISDLGTTWTCIQGCHDPDCFGRGCPITISKNDKHYPEIEREWQSFQEEQFENALLALNMDDITNIANNDDDDDESSKNRMNNEQKEEENEQSHATNSYAEEAKEKRNRETSAGDGDDEYGLSDTALLEAALSNPELFP